MPAERSYDGLLERLLVPRIGERPLGFPRRVHDFVERAARNAGQSRASLLEGLLAGRTPELLDGLIDAATVGHTAFFRHPLQFDHLRGLLPQLQSSRSRPLELWCAGCSTGEEAYSLALCAEELGVSVRILATDVNPRAIQMARAGHYREGPRTSARDAASEWTAPEALKRLIRFELASLMGENPAPEAVRFDVIFCRNVLIYFERESVPTILARLAGHLTPGGAIVVSPADAVLPLPQCLTWSSPAGWLTLRAKKDRFPSPFEARPGPADPEPRPAHGADGDANSPLEEAARLLQTGQRDEAEQLLSDLLNQDPSDVVAWFLLGEALLRRGEQVQAQLAFRRASGLTASPFEGIDLDDDSAVADARLTLRLRSNRTS